MNLTRRFQPPQRYQTISNQILGMACASAALSFGQPLQFRSSLRLSSMIGRGTSTRIRVCRAAYFRPVLRYDLYFFSYATAFLVMNYILRKNFGQFRIGLLSHRGGDGGELLRPTLRRTIPVWWTYCWRTFVYGLIAMFVTTIPRAFLVERIEFWNLRWGACLASP
jgi:hypothetical protein